MRHSMPRILLDKANLITLTNCLIGFGALILLRHDLIEWVLVVIMTSFYLDHIDGTVARATVNRPPRFEEIGGALDSFADLINFGLVPAMINYTINDASYLALAASSLLVATSVLRLSYYNVFGLDEGYFVGLNTTYSGCIFVIALTLLSILPGAGYGAFSFILIGVSLFQISSLRVPKHRFKGSTILFFSLAVAGVSLFIVGDPL